MRRYATLGIALILLLVSDLRAQEPSGPTADNPPPAAQQPPAGQTVNAPATTEPEWPTWGVIDATGSGVVVHRSAKAELSVGAYALVRYINHVDRSPVSSVFGFYVGGQKGPTVSVATSFYF
jgi:hypothetical protein